MQPRQPSGTASVLFTDLVESTALLSRLGESAFDELRRAHFDTLRGAVERAGGDLVKTLGDGVLAVFGSATRAVEAAVAIQQEVDRQGSATPGLAVRVGVALGDVGFEDGDVFGTPVVEAARLAAAARSGQILATALVRDVAGGRSAATFTDVEPMSLRGLPGPVPTCEVSWERLSPARPGPVGPPPSEFVGRAHDLARLTSVLERALAGRS